MTNLLERIELVLEDKDWSAAEWTRRAGIKEKTHMSTLMGRLRKNPNASPDSKTIAKLADAAGVSLDWLLLGRGTPGGAFVLLEPDARYPSRSKALGAARMLGYRLDAIERVAAVSGFEGDPGLDYWMAALRLENESPIKRLPAPAPVPKKRATTRKRSK